MTSIGQRVIEGIADGVILRGICAEHEEHPVVLVFSANAAEQIEAIIKDAQIEALARCATTETFSNPEQGQCVWRAWSPNIGWHEKIAQEHQWVKSYTGNTRACYRCWRVERLVTPAVPAPEPEIAELRKQAAPLLYAEQAAHVTGELLPCPFCGHETAMSIETDDEYAEINTEVAWYKVVCDANDDGCGSSSGFKPTAAEAVALWNTRVRHI